ncbi:MAG: lasso peptide biosynthesis B2 protein [Acidobacteriota bacterium]|nr:lasso peptide biosynthesis B2 protein [Acidobacteriota bacterium]
MGQTTRWRRFRARPAGDRWLLLRALAILAGVRILLRACPWPVAARLLAEPTRVRSAAKAGDAAAAIDRLRWAVVTVAHEVPGASCLAQAVTLQILLARDGYDSSLRLGVLAGPDIPFAAHAWLERDGVTLVGQTARAYAPLAGGRSLFGRQPRPSPAGPGVPLENSPGGSTAANR